MLLSHDNVLITGGSRGIGAAAVRAFAAQGANVAFTYHTNRTAAEALVRELRPACVMAIPCDAADPVQVREAVRQAERQGNEVFYHVASRSAAEVLADRKSVV